MKRITNIAKAIIGNLPVGKQETLFETLSWRNKKIVKHQNDKTEKSIKLSGFTICYKRPYELLHTYEELFENQIYKFATPTDKPLIIDCGANIGLSVLYFKALCPNAEIIAFEPDINNFALLKTNIAANQLSFVTLHQAAVWTHNDTLNFSSAGSEASHVSERPDPETISVRAMRLADLLSQHDKIDFLKIDIEGAEGSVLEDCKNHLASVQNLFLEYHGKTAETQKLKNILSIIEQAGFSTYIQNAADLLQHPYINKTTNGIYDVQLNIFCFRKD